MRGEYRRYALEHTDELRFRSQQEKHELSELYKAKIRNMSNAARNGGEYYILHPLSAASIQVTKPQISETVYEGTCGSGGLLRIRELHTSRFENQVASDLVARGPG